MSVLFPESDILKILTNRKTATCRNYPLQVGSRVSFMAGFKVFAVCEVTAVTHIPDIRKIDHDTVRKLGFKTRKSYLEQSYNTSNDSHERYMIKFVVVENRINEYIAKWL